MYKLLIGARVPNGYYITKKLTFTLFSFTLTLLKKQISRV